MSKIFMFEHDEMYVCAFEVIFTNMHHTFIIMQ